MLELRWIDWAPILEDMLRAYTFKWQGEWDRHLKLVEFSYNNNYHSSIGTMSFEALYGRLIIHLISYRRFENPLID